MSEKSKFKEIIKWIQVEKKQQKSYLWVSRNYLEGLVTKKTQASSCHLHGSFLLFLQCSQSQKVAKQALKHLTLEEVTMRVFFPQIGQPEKKLQRQIGQHLWNLI